MFMCKPDVVTCQIDARKASEGMAGKVYGTFDEIEQR